MNDPMLKLQILTRAELALARIHARRVANRSIFLAVAVVLVLFSLAMLNYAAYQALAARYSPASGAILVALLDALLAVVVIAVSGRSRGNQAEEVMAREIRALARAELQNDIEGVKTDLTQVGETVARVRDGITVLSGGGSNSLAALLGLVTRALKKGTKPIRSVRRPKKTQTKPKP